LNLRGLRKKNSEKMRENEKERREEDERKWDDGGEGKAAKWGGKGVIGPTLTKS